MALAAPAVDASIGASVSVLFVNADERFGLGEDHNTLGLYGEGCADGRFKADVDAFLGVGTRWILRLMSETL